MNIILGADHRGFTLKEHIKFFLQNKHIDFIDVSTFHDPKDDFPLVAQKVAEKVIETPDTLAIVLCGSGAGIDIAMNKFDRIRSVLALNSEQVKASRRDDNVNVLTLAADYTDTRQAELFVDAFLNTSYIPNERHTRRLKEIERIEDEN